MIFVRTLFLTTFVHDWNLLLIAGGRDWSMMRERERDCKLASVWCTNLDQKVSCTSSFFFFFLAGKPKGAPRAPHRGRGGLESCFLSEAAPLYYVTRLALWIQIMWASGFRKMSGSHRGQQSEGKFNLLYCIEVNLFLPVATARWSISAIFW